MSTMRSAFRNHLPFIIIVPILLVLMTWPAIVYVFDTQTFWLPTDGKDVWIEIWQALHGRSILAGEADLYFTNMLFYPVGLSLVYHSANVFQMILLAILQPIMGTSNAYNLLFLLIILATALSAYVYLIYIFNHRWLALFGAVVFGFSQHVVGHSNNLALSLLITIPLSLYALQRGIEEEKWKWTLLSGVLVGSAAFMSMYILVCLLLTLGLFTIFFACRAWRKPRFWVGMTLLLTVAASISMLRVYPMMRESSGLDEALGKNAGQESNNDLLSFFVNGGHPWLTPVFAEVFALNAPGELNFREQHKTSYLGYLPLFLIVLGFSSAKHRRKMFPWLILLTLFLILRLGSMLRVNGVLYPDVLLPKHFLNAVFPFIFPAFHETDHFQIGVLLPLSVLSCFGLRVLLQSVPKRYCHIAAVGAVALLAFEYYQPLVGQVIPERQLAFNDWLRNEPNQEDIRLVNLPMGRSNSKIYGFYQVINGYPHAEGLAHRTPDKSYNYILQNHLLVTWHKSKNSDCSSGAFDRYLAAADQLLGDGFSHVLLHHGARRVNEVADSFRNIPPAYQDEYVSVYRVPALREICLDRVADYQNQLPILQEFLHAPVNRPRGDVSLLVLYPAEVYSSDARRPFDIALSEWKDLIHVVHDSRGAATVVNSNAERIDLDSIAAEDSLFWLIYNPGESDPKSQSQFATWMDQNLRFCQQIRQGEDLAVEYYIDRDYPCELVVTGDPLELRYDNGIILANSLTEFDGDRFSVDSWWQRGDIDGYAYTIQVFDEEGEKQLQIDQVIDSRPLSRATFDAGSLEPGDYVAKLIVYETDSGRSQRGATLSAQQTVERELEIARFRVQA
ncbi:MAG: glycosyltransferase family 39 protein [Chloroflexi bacterium]|nr:glycosyltransferase family 39 protein [Chloroflexota bacterium]